VKFSELKCTVKEQDSLKSVDLEPRCSMRTQRRTGGQTDLTSLIIDFLNFAQASIRKKIHPTKHKKNLGSS